jgi:hypothetical protein
MILSVNLAFVATILLFVGVTSAHPGDDHREELIKRAEWLGQVERRDLSHCAGKLKARGIHAKSHLRRRELADTRRKKRGLASGKHIESLF